MDAKLGNKYELCIINYELFCIFAPKLRTMKYATCIKQIEIEALWSGKKHILWQLDPHVNILSGINGVGKSTILNKVFRSVCTNGDLVNHLLKGVHITADPEDATHIRFDIIRSLDSPVLDNETLNMVDARIRSALDFQLYHLQRKYLDYQVNIGNRIIEELQKGNADAAQKLSKAKARFQDLVDDLFAETGKKIVRTENEIRFSQIGETLVPYQLSSGEKQMLAILLTVLVEDEQPYVLFMDEPEVSLHIEWQKRLIELIVELNPNVQIILTTHSPAVIMNGWLDKVTEVSDITIGPLS
jgi:ABC-type glutathione transport system ATPase component